MLIGWGGVGAVGRPVMECRGVVGGRRWRVSCFLCVDDDDSTEGLPMK